MLSSQGLDTSRTVAYWSETIRIEYRRYIVPHIEHQYNYCTQTCALFLDLFLGISKEVMKYYHPNWQQTMQFAGFNLWNLFLTALNFAMKVDAEVSKLCCLFYIYLGNYCFQDYITAFLKWLISFWCLTYKNKSYSWLFSLHVSLFQENI